MSALAHPSVIRNRWQIALAAVGVGGGVGLLVGRAEAQAHPQWLVEFAMGMLALLCAYRWRLGIYLVLLYVTVEGLVSNSLYPSTIPLIFKDVLLGATYLGFLAGVGRQKDGLRFSARLVAPLGALAALCAAEALNPWGVSPPVALVGMRVLLFYIPLYFLGLTLSRDAHRLSGIVRFILYSSLPITLFGVYQWAIGWEAVASLGPGFARAIWVIGPEATADPIYRPASTFAFVGHFGAYLLFISILAFAALHLPIRRWRRMLLAAVLACAVAAVVVQAQRTTWVLLPVAAAGMYLLHRHRSGMLRAMPILVGSVIAAAFIGGSVLSNRLPLLTSGLDFYTAHFSSSTGEAFRSANFLSPEGIIGHGTGTALGAIRYVTGGTVPSAFESGWFVPFYMFGVFGLIVYAWFFGAVLTDVWRGCQTMQADVRWLGVGIFCFLALTTVLDGPSNYPPTNIYFWLFAGMLAGLIPASRNRTADRITDSSPSGWRPDLEGLRGNP